VPFPPARIVRLSPDRAPLTRYQMRE